MTAPSSHIADVDVVIPLYNMAAFVEEAIASVLAGTVLPRSITVVDDGSSDGGGERVEALSASHGTGIRITLIKQENQGPNAARNTGTRSGEGAMVAYLDADDLWMPQKLEAQLAVMATSQAALVYCGYQEIDSHGAPLPGARPTEPVLQGNAFHELLLANRISGSASAVLIRRAVLDELGPFDVSLRGSEDWDMWLRIAERYPLAFAEGALVAVRKHASNAQRDNALMLRNMIAAYRKWFVKARGDARVMKEWGHLIAEFALRTTDRAAAISLVEATFDPKELRSLFPRTNGSLRRYMWLKRIRAFFAR